jgi:hypothetical protein
LIQKDNLYPIESFPVVKGVVEGSLTNAKAIYHQFNHLEEDDIKFDKDTYRKTKDQYLKELETAHRFDEQIMHWKQEVPKASALYDQILRLEENQGQYVETIKKIIDLSEVLEKQDDDNLLL